MFKSNKRTNAPYLVHRVHAWPDGEFYVEVVAGRDSSNPGVLASTPAYRRLGEGEEFSSPRCAVIAALRIRRLWRQAKPDEDLGLVHNGQVAGEWGIPGEEVDAVELIQWAKREEAGLVRCDECGEIVTGEAITIMEFETAFCGDYCAESYFEKLQQENAEFMEDW